MSQNAKIPSERTIIVRPNDVSRPYGRDNPDFGTLLVGDLKISFVCRAERNSPVTEDCYPIRPKLAGYVEKEEELPMLERYGIVFEEGKLCVLPAPTASCPVIEPPSPVVGAAVSSEVLEGRGGKGECYSFTASGLPTGLSMSTDGAISGTPLVSGTFPYIVTVKDLEGHTDTIRCSMTVLPAPTACCAVISPVVGSNINSSLVGSGTGAPYHFSSLDLPTGLTMTSDGEISGTPQQSGSSQYTVAVTDSAGNRGSVTCPVTVLPAPTACCAGINAVQNNPITSVKLVGSGGVGGPYQFSFLDLPTGLTMTSDGAISGTPQQSGSSQYTVAVTDSAGNQGTVTCSIKVLPAPTAICAVISPVVGVNVTSSPLLGSGGVGGPYTFTASSLPTGLTMSNDGKISGTLSVSGTFPYTVTVTDSGGNKGTVTCQVSVLSAPTASCPVISPVVGVNMKSSPLMGSGGIGGPYTFMASGLPRGLSMSGNGTMSGTPSVSGTVSYTITVKDSAGNTGTVTCSVTVLSARAAQLEKAKEDLDHAIRLYEAESAETVPQHERIRALSALIHSSSKLKTELELPAASAELHEHGFLLSFPPEANFPLSQGSSARVRVFKPGQAQAIATLHANPRTGEVYFAANEGDVYDFEALLNEFPIQRITLIST